WHLGAARAVPGEPPFANHRRGPAQFRYIPSRPQSPGGRVTMSQVTRSASAAAPIHETLRIAGEKVDRDERIDVMNPWDDSVVGTVPRATRDDVRRAFDIAAAYRPKLTRYQRQQILVRTAGILTSRKDEISD